jgi:hypothetical protein
MMGSLEDESDAAKESNLPSEGLPRPARFEDGMGHQARAAPQEMLCGREGRAAPEAGGGRLEAVKPVSPPLASATVIKCSRWNGNTGLMGYAPQRWCAHSKVGMTPPTLLPPRSRS